MSNKIRTYAELRELIRVSLRIQHPEWVEPNGDSPVCDSYEARFAELLGLTQDDSAKASTSTMTFAHHHYANNAFENRTDLTEVNL
jgi:hypothetical protein